MQYGSCLGITFDFLTMLLRIWTNICQWYLVVMHQRRSSVCVTRISLGSIINAGMLASSRRLIFGGPVIALGLTGKSLSAGKWDLMKATRRPSVSLATETEMFLWMFIPIISGGPLLSLRCSARVRHCLISLVRVVDWCVSRLVRLICCRIILTASWWSPLPCHPSPTLTTFGFRSSEVRPLLLDLNPYSVTDPLGMFPLFLKRTADVMAPCHSVVVRRLVRVDSFLACWRQPNVTPIPKDPPSSSVAKYRPISVTSLLSKVFELLVSVCLRFMESSGVLLTTQFACRKGLCTCNALLCVSHRLQSALESGQEDRIVQIDFSAALDGVNHFGILYKLCSVCIGGSVPSILTQFLSNRSQHVMVDGYQSKLVNVVSGVMQGSVLARCCFSCTRRSFFPFWKISWSVMLMTPLWWQLCHTHASEFQQQSPWSMTLSGLVSGVTFGGWKWMRVRQRLW